MFFNKFYVTLAGCGLTGIASVIAGANSTLTDLGTYIDHLKLNLDLNGITANVGTLDWFAPSSLAVPPANFDIIIGAECVYLESLVEPLVQTIHYHLKPDGVCYLVSAKGRAGYLHFFHLMSQLGFVITTQMLLPPNCKNSSFTFSEDLTVGWFCEGQFTSELNDLILVRCSRNC